MTPRDLTLAALGVLSVALAAVIALELAMPPAPAPQAAPPSGIADLPAAAAEDVSGLVPTILARPLFSPDRRPKATAAASAGPTDEMPRLGGVLIDGPERRAIFQPGGDAKPIAAGEGDQVAGWRVQRITAEGVTLEGPAGTRTLEPKPDPALAAAMPPASPVMPPGTPGMPQGAPSGGSPAANARQYLPGGMALPPGVPNPFGGQVVPAPGRPRPATPQQPPVRQQGSAPAAPNRR